MARSNERHIKIYRRIWFVLESEKLNRSTNRKFNSKWDPGEVINVFDSKFYHKFTISSKKECYFSSMWYVVKDNTFYSKNRENIGRETNETV